MIDEINSRKADPEAIKQIIESTRAPLPDPNVVKEINEGFEKRAKIKSEEIKDIVKESEKRIKKYAGMTEKSWWRTMTSTLPRVMGNTYIFGVVTAFASNAVQVVIANSAIGALNAIGIAAGVGATGAIAGAVGALAATRLVFEIYDQRNTIAKHPISGVGMVCKRVVGRTLLGVPGIVVANIFPSFGGKIAGGVISGVLTNIFVRMKPTSLSQAKNMELEQLYATAKWLQEGMELKYGKDLSLQELNQNKVSYLRLIAAKAVSIATVLSFAGVIALGATDTGKQLYSDLFIEWRNDNPYVAPVINGLISEKVFPLIRLDKFTKGVGEYTKKLLEKVSIGKAHVAPKTVRDFFRKRAGTETLEELTFGALVGMSLDIGVNVAAFKYFSYKVNDSLAVTKQWYSKEESSDMMRNFYDAALQKSIASIGVVKSAGTMLNEAFAAGVSAISTSGVISRLYNPNGTGLAAESVKEGIAAVNEASAMINEQTTKTHQEFVEAVNRAQQRIAVRMRNLDRIREMENLENASAALGVTFSTMAQLRAFQGNLANFAVENPEGYKEVLEGKVPTFTTASLLQRGLAQQNLGIGTVLNIYTAAKDIVHSLGASMRIGSWMFRGAGVIQSVADKMPEIQQQSQGTCSNPGAEISASFGAAPEQCKVEEAPAPEAIPMLPPLATQQTTSFMANVLSKSSDLFYALDSVMPSVPTIGPITVTPWRAINAVYGGFTVENAGDIATEVAVGTVGAEQVRTAAAAPGTFNE